MYCKKIVFRNLESIPSLYKCWICGQIPKNPQFKYCEHSRLLNCFQCLKLQRCRYCKIENKTNYYSLDPPEIFTNHLNNIFIHCLNCNDNVQGFKFSSHENKCNIKLKQMSHFELLGKNIFNKDSLDSGQLDYMKIQYQLRHFLKLKFQVNEEYLLEIQELLVKCKLCFSILLYTELSEHQNSCPFQSVECENYCCNWIGQRQQFKNHLLGCFPISQEKLENQYYILIRTEEYIGINMGKINQEQNQNYIEFQNIMNSIQTFQITKVQSEIEVQSEYEDQD